MVLILYFTSFSHKFHKGAVHKVRQAIFGQFLPPSPCHTLSHIPGPSPPNKYVTHLGPPIFSRPSTKTRTKAPCTNSLSIVRGGFVREVFRGSLVWKVLSGVVFVCSPFCQNASVITES